MKNIKWFYVGVAVAAGSLGTGAGCGPDVQSGGSPAPPPEVVAVYGDSRTGHDVHYDIVQAMLAACPRYVVHTGDLVEDGSNPALWTVFNLITAPLRATCPMYPVLGNHENNSPLYFENFELPGNERWYAVEGAGMKWVALDTNVDFTPSSEQYQWLRAELARPYDGPVAVVMHHPPYSVVRQEETSVALQRYLVPLFEEAGVDVVFAGHDHSYQRFLVNGVTYIVTGGGGAPLYERQFNDPRLRAYARAYHYCLLEVAQDHVELEVISREGEVLDAATIPAGGRKTSIPLPRP